MKMKFKMFIGWSFHISVNTYIIFIVILTIWRDKVLFIAMLKDMWYACGQVYCEQFFEKNIRGLRHHNACCILKGLGGSITSGPLLRYQLLWLGVGAWRLRQSMWYMGKVKGHSTLWTQQFSTIWTWRTQSRIQITSLTLTWDQTKTALIAIYVSVLNEIALRIF